MGYNNYWGQPGYTYYGPSMVGGYYPWSNFNSYSTTRYYADNIILLSFSDNGKIEWSNVIHKSQYDDNSDSYIS
ncbi:hypothetical protein ABTF87_19130, partial [Acinetobacter baumannii]